MDKVEIVKKAMSFDTSPDEGKTYYADNFQATDSVGSPAMDKQAWFGMGDVMRASFPDISYEMEEVRQRNRLSDMRQEWGKMARFFLIDEEDD